MHILKRKFTLPYLVLSLNAFNTTVKLLIVIAKAAIIGFISTPNGSSIPHAIGIIHTL